MSEFAFFPSIAGQSCVEEFTRVLSMEVDASVPFRTMAVQVEFTNFMSSVWIYLIMAVLTIISLEKSIGQCVSVFFYQYSRYSILHVDLQGFLNQYSIPHSYSTWSSNTNITIHWSVDEYIDTLMYQS